MAATAQSRELCSGHGGVRRSSPTGQRPGAAEGRRLEPGSPSFRNRARLACGEVREVQAGWGSCLPCVDVWIAQLTQRVMLDVDVSQMDEDIGTNCGVVHSIGIFQDVEQLSRQSGQVPSISGVRHPANHVAKKGDGHLQPRARLRHAAAYCGPLGVRDRRRRVGSGGLKSRVAQGFWLRGAGAARRLGILFGGM